MDIKDSYLHGTIGVVKSINVNADELTYTLADKQGTQVKVTLPPATVTTNGVMSNSDKVKLNNLNIDYFSNIVNYKISFPDNSGRDSYILIAKLTSWIDGKNSDYGFVGRIVGYRGGNQQNTCCYNLIATLSSYVYNNATTYIKQLYVDKHTGYLEALPCVVTYNGENYLALRKLGSGCEIYFEGAVKNILPQSQWIVLNTPSEKSLPDNMTVLHSTNFTDAYSITTSKYYDGSNIMTLLHSGNFANYTVKKDGTGAEGTWPINISGTAGTATNATNVSITTSSSNGDYPLLFTTNVTAGNKRIYTDSANELKYNPSTNTLTTTKFVGDLAGNLTLASLALCSATESNEIKIVENTNSAITTNPTNTNGLSSIRKALDFRWYNSHWLIGNIRSGSTSSDGFGVTYGNDNLRFRVTTTDCFVGADKILHAGNYTNYINTTNFPGLNKTGTVTSVTLNAGGGISIDNTSAITSTGTRTITNTGVRSISTGSTNGTISVNTNGTSAEVAVKGLASGAFATAYSHPNSGATAGSYGPSTNATPTHGGTFSVPYFTINAQGHVTAASTKTITLPTDTDTKNTAGSTNSTSKMYLIGATSQANNPQTYSNSAIYATNGTLTTSGVGKDGYIAYPKDGYYSSSKSSETGYLCITLPQSWSNTMIKFDVNIFNYLNNTSVTYTVSGYNYFDVDANIYSWYNVSAYSVGHHLGNLSNLPVIFGHNGTKCVVYIGTATTTWAYPKIAISNITLGWFNTTTEKWSTGWGFSFTTSLGTYNANVRNTHVGYLSQLLQGKRAADFTAKHSWECTINKNTWSRLCLVKYSENHAGASYILNVLEHRTSVVYNYTYLVNTHHDKKGHITLLNNSNFAYSGDSEARLVVDTYGNNYFEFRDGARLSDSWTSATVKCELIPLSTGDITKYTTYTSGSSVPSGYAVATTVLHTGTGIPSLICYYTDALNLTSTLNLTATKNITNSSLTSPIKLFELSIQIPALSNCLILFNSSTNFALWGVLGADYIDPHSNNADYILTPNYSLVIDGIVVKSGSDGSLTIALGSTTKYTVSNNGHSTKTIKVLVFLNSVTNRDKVSVGKKVRMASAPGMYKITNMTNFGFSTAMKTSATVTYSDPNTIKFDYTFTRTGGFLRDAENSKYHDGFVHINSSNQAITYSSLETFYVRRGNYCLKVDKSLGILQSTNGGQSWSPITGMVTPL